MRPEEKYCGALFMVFNLFLYVLQILLSQNACNNYEKVVKILLLLEYLLKNSEKIITSCFEKLLEGRIGPSHGLRV
jgi:hypothetical protein